MTTNTKAQQLLDFGMIDDDSYQIDGCDDAIIGAVDQRIVYSYELLIEVFYNCFLDDNQDESTEDVYLMAQEWVDFNVTPQCDLHNNKNKMPLIIYTI